MYNILICIDNIKNLHFIVNEIYKKLNDINIYEIVTSKEEMMKKMKLKVVDIVILYLNDSNTLISISKYIENLEFEKHSKSFIWISNKKNIKDIKNNKSIFYLTDLENFIECILNILKNKFKYNCKIGTYLAINKELSDLNFNFNQCGTKYLAESILEIYYINDYDNMNLSQNIYPIIAKKYNKSVNNIKTNITKAYSNMFNNCSNEYLEYYLKICIIKNKKPKTNDLILGVIRHISNIC